MYRFANKGEIGVPCGEPRCVSLFRRANRLVVMERGQIVEVGPHQELLDRNGLYARLYRAQSESPEERNA